ncbi:hypothetical protein FNV43_RR15047 [Rhamnella rubrinervis]|uniref:Methyltransferase domain-containing protein n=1 Tax=Rhamnella rubrinervis TaxID=2594499 RepID=A0A8K0E6K4_9ROSA|nr:hypothetical protein FNV43_RR15047 [Rhamnella rubrinervis]
MAASAGARECKYSCETATQTLLWIHAIIDFIRPYSFLTNAHVVNFFKDRLWEAVDKEWIECLRKEPVENLLQIPSGIVQEHWPASLKEFVFTSRSLAFPREQTDLQKALPGLNLCPLNSVLSQGMNLKKKHEVEVLSAIVSSIASNVGAPTIIDVGAGQGYLAQVLSFHYRHCVIAIDACSHHGRVTNARAERIKKYYAAQMRNSEPGKRNLIMPKTITCRVISNEMLKSLAYKATREDIGIEQYCATHDSKLQQSSCNADNVASLVLAGLHACGDLSVMMLKTFLDCEEVKSVISIGCCYNLLSEEGFNHVDSQCGFPMSFGVKSTCFSLGKCLLDLACQSAERWRCMENDAGLHNFWLHAFRGAFQMVLTRYYPDVVTSSPIGRQGKTLRRRQQRATLDSLLHKKESICSQSNMNGNCPPMELKELETDDGSTLAFEAATLSHGNIHIGSKCEAKSVDQYPLFLRYTLSGLCRLGLKPLQDINFQGIWNEVEPFAELIGPYWSLRAALGPVLETLLLLDRLLFLQEQGGSIEAVMLPIFDPALSPRNVAIIARKS